MKTHNPMIRMLLCIGMTLLIFTNVLAQTDISSTPLATSSPTQAKPNIFYVLDDSGSMAWNYLPDWATYDYSANDHSSSTTCYGWSCTFNNAPNQLFQNSGYNGVYYNPAVTYTPPVNYAGVSYSSMTSANTSSWTSVPDDAYGVQSTNKSNLVGNASYYLFTPGEYCTDRHERTCVAQTAPDPAHPYPAYLRWCTDATLTTCQATRIDTGTGTQYTYARYPGYGGTAASTTLTITGTTSTTVSGILVNGVQIMSGTASSGSNATNRPKRLAQNIATLITLAGYSATASSTTNWWNGVVTGYVTIVAPSSAGPITYTPSVTQSGSMNIAVAPFANGSSGVPGSDTQTVITSTTPSYSHPGTSRTDCVDPSDTASTCTYAEEMTNYANWWAYYQTRMQMTKTAAALAFSVLDSKYRIGYMSINNNTGTDFLNIADIPNPPSTAGGQKQLWYNKFLAASPNNGTGTRQALATAGLYYAGKLYNTTVNGVSNVNDPMQYACQRNFTILSTDGYWNEGNTNSTTTDTPVAANSANTFNPYLSGIVTIDGKDIGDQDASLALPFSEGVNTTYDTMADVTAYYYNTDIRSSTFGNATNPAGVDVSAGKQYMSTSTMGLGASGFMQYQKGYATAQSGDYHDVAVGNTAGGATCSWQTSGTTCSWPIPVSNAQTAIDDLWHAAVNAGGRYYSAQNPTDVKQGLVDFLASIQATLGSSSGATVSSPNVTQTNNSEYLSTFMSQDWDGELAKYTIDPTTGIAHQYADWSESGIAFAAATTNTSPLLDLQDAAGTRTILTYDATQNTQNPTGLTTFSWPSLSPTVQSYFNASVASGLSQWSSLPASAQATSTAAGTSNGAAGYNLVAYLAGDRSNEGTAGGKYYRQRKHILGDMVDSQPAYVTAPAYNYPDPGYAAFATTNSSRASMVYVGANDGMLHAFNGVNGAEAFGYIPSMVLPNLYHLADQNYATNHLFFVDGSPASGDVCVSNCTSSTTASWKTILVGGLGDGGRGYYALDVTNPSSPALLWEFTYDTTKTGGKYVSDQDLGLSYGKPVITKLSDGTWVVLVTSGYNNTSPGSGHGILYVLNASTGAIIKKIDTGVGSSSSPSGLAHIGAYAPTNNTTLYAYGGDLNGNLWRFDISALKGDGTGTVATQLLATLKDNGSPAQPQPITTAPVTGNKGGNILVFVGTGQFLGLSDLTTSQTQSIYAIKDTLAVTAAPLLTAVYANPRTNLCTVTSTTNCFVKNTLVDSTAGVRTASSSIVANFGTMDGWFADLPETGERINTEMNLQLGILVFTSNIPGTGTACSAGGSSYLNYVNYTTGLALPTQTNVGILLTTTNGATALANSPTLTIGSSGQVISNTTTANGGIVTTSLGQTGSTKGTRRISWRELMTN